MSRIEDIVDLIRVANEVFLLNPSQNIRSAYIQIDDICELAIKSYLEKNRKNWSAIHNNGRFKTFHDICNEIVSANIDTIFIILIDRIKSRRDNRNHFFHDQSQTALTVSERHCLEAYIDLYELMHLLFGESYLNVFSANTIYKSQVSLIKLKYKALDGGEAWSILNEFTRDNIPIRAHPNAIAFDVLAIFNAVLSFDKLKICLENAIEQNKSRLAHLDNQTSSDKKSKERREVQKVQITNSTSKLIELIEFCINN